MSNLAYTQWEVLYLYLPDQLEVMEDYPDPQSHL